MPPTRLKPGSSSSSSHKQKRHRQQDDEGRGRGVGVQKLKAQLRSATRLLGKDGLDAALRIETERRVEALQNEIAQATVDRKETAMASRYHMVKFFDKKKVLRKINRLKKTIQNGAANGKERNELEEELFERRVDLNYILHYPRLEKYIALFPSSSGENDEEEEDKSLPQTSQSPTDAQREAMRDSIRQSMKDNTLSGEPELDESSADSNKKKHGKRRQERTHVSQSVSKTDPKPTAAEEDDFFGEDDD